MVLRFKNTKFSGYFFISSREYSEIFNSALVYLQSERKKFVKRFLLPVG